MPALNYQLKPRSASRPRVNRYMAAALPKSAGLALILLLGMGCAASGDGKAVGDADSKGRTPISSKPVASVPIARPVRADFVLDGDMRQGGIVRGSAPSDTVKLLLNGNAVPVAPDGRFIIGFDRDAPANATLVAELRSGANVTRPLAIAAGDWRIEHINARATGSAKTTAEFERRRSGELAQMAKARATVVTSDGWRQDFIWPVKGRLSGYFGSQRVYQGEPGNYHNGTDIAVPTGTPFVAPADGVVILAADQPFTLEGLILMIDHGNGLSSVFLHNSRLDVKTGDVVRQGQTLGAIGATGRVTGPHMHWAMRWRGEKVDSKLMAEAGDRARAARLPAPSSTPPPVK